MLLWRVDVQLRVVSSSLNHVDAIINDSRDNTWRFTGFYGAPKTSNRHISWNLGYVREILMRFLSLMRSWVGGLDL